MVVVAVGSVGHGRGGEVGADSGLRRGTPGVLSTVEAEGGMVTVTVVDMAVVDTEVEAVAEEVEDTEELAETLDIAEAMEV